MGTPWAAWDDIPPLVDANGVGSQAPRSIPPPPGAAFMPSMGPPPHTAPTGMQQQFPWGPPFSQFTSPAPQLSPFGHGAYPMPTPPDPYIAWRQWYNGTSYPQQSGPSPYLPRQPLRPETQPHDHPRRTNPQPNSHKRSNSFHVHLPWPSEGGGDLSPLDLQTRMPDVQSFTPRALDMHTPSSSFSRSTSSSSSSPYDWYHKRPQQWRNDFKFKSGFSSMFRSKSNIGRALDGVVDGAKLDLHPYLRFNKSRPIAIYDLRREPLTLMFRGLDRPPLADDMDHSITRPATQYMRIYHPRLPWYIEIRPNGAPYISLADFFQQLFAALSKSISKHDFYNNELDDEDRDILTRAYLERCRTEDEKMEGVKRVDFLRGKFEWMGLIPGKNGMWRLKTAG